MPNLFGLDIAQILADELAAAGNLRPGTLTSVNNGAIDAGDPTGPPTDNNTAHSFQGFVELGQKRISQERVVQDGNFMTIIGRSVSPLIAPKVGDEATIDSMTYELVELIERDPAAATYIFRVA